MNYSIYPDAPMAGFAAPLGSAADSEWVKGRKLFMRKWRMQRGCCALCGQPFAPEQMTRDHIVPRSKGGATCWDNIQLACAPCNEQKGDALPPNAEVSDRRGGGSLD